MPLQTAYSARNEVLKGKKECFTLIYATQERNGLPSRYQLSWTNNSHHVLLALCLSPFTSSYPTLSRLPTAKCILVWPKVHYRGLKVSVYKKVPSYIPDKSLFKRIPRAKFCGKHFCPSRKTIFTPFFLVMTPTNSLDKSHHIWTVLTFFCSSTDNDRQGRLLTDQQN